MSTSASTAGSASASLTAKVDEAVLDLGVLAVGRSPIEGEDGVHIGRLGEQAHDPPADGPRRPGHDHTLHALTLARPGGIPSPALPTMNG